MTAVSDPNNRVNDDIDDLGLDGTGEEKVDSADLEDIIEHAAEKVAEIIKGAGNESEKVEGVKEVLVRSISITQSHSGPLPPPAILKEYDNILPGAAERIFAMTEKEQGFRHEMTKSEIAFMKRFVLNAQRYGFIFLLIILIITSVAIYLHQFGIATATFITALITIGYVYFWGNKIKKKKGPDQKHPLQV